MTQTRVQYRIQLERADCTEQTGYAPPPSHCLPTVLTLFEVMDITFRIWALNVYCQEF